MENGNGSGFGLRHAFLLLDGSGSMHDPERSGEPKHRAVASMVQQIIEQAHQKFTDTFLSVLAYDADGDNHARVTELLLDYDVSDSVYNDNTNLDLWDPLPQHGGNTPIGAVLAYAREKAETWVRLAQNQEQRRAVIYLLSDGMNNVGPDGTEQRALIDTFNKESTQGKVRLACVGYFQHGLGVSTEEDAGRELLRRLSTTKVFESSDVSEIIAYILSTMTVLG